MRRTRHAVAADDYPAFHGAMVDLMRRARVFDRRFTAGGIAVAEAEAVIPALVAFAPTWRSNAEFEAAITERGLPGKHVWFALRRYGPFWHAPTEGPWSFNDRPSYMAARATPFDGKRETALPLLLRRYLEAFGPASAAD